MIIRAISGDNDWLLGKGKSSYLRDNNAIAENIQTRLMSFLGDCFFDLQAGIDWFRLLSTNGTENEIVLTCRRIIVQSYGVTKVNDLIFDVTANNRGLTISYNIDTIFSLNFAQNTGVANA